MMAGWLIYLVLVRNNFLLQVVACVVYLMLQAKVRYSHNYIVVCLSANYNEDKHLSFCDNKQYKFYCAQHAWPIKMIMIVPQKHYSVDFVSFFLVDSFLRLPYSFSYHIYRKLARWCNGCMCLGLGTNGCSCECWRC